MTSEKPHFWPILSIFRTALCLLGVAFPAFAAQQPASSAARVVGTVQSISGATLAVISDSGAPSAVSTESATKFLQIAPGQTDLKQATPIAFADLQPGDRVLVRGILADDGKTIRAASVIAVKKAAIAEKQTKERSEWQRGVGGIVKKVDQATSTISIGTNSLAANKDVAIHYQPETIFRRYASDSTRFDSAKVASISEVHEGDQLRARGTRSGGGADFAAVEIVSGTFRSISGIISSSDPGSNSLVVQDLATKAPVTLKITAESQMRKLPPQFAEGLAARLRNPSGAPVDASASADGGAANSASGAQTPGVQSSPAQSTSGQSSGGQSPAGQASGAPANNSDNSSGRRRNGAPAQNPQQGTAPGATQVGRGSGAGGDFQQVIARMPAATLADLQKGDAVMVVTTQGNGKDPLTVITLLGGVEAILRAPKSSQDMVLSPWSLGNGEPAGN